MKRFGPTVVSLAFVVAMLVCAPAVLAQHTGKQHEPIPDPIVTGVSIHAPSAGSTPYLQVYRDGSATPFDVDVNVENVVNVPAPKNLLTAQAAAAAVPVLRSAATGKSARAGAMLPVRLTITNGAARAARRVKVAVSVIPAVSGSAIKLRAVVIPTLKARFTTHARVSVVVPASQFVGTFTVRACVAGHCATTGKVQLLPGDAYDKLAAAVAAHKLSPGKAGLYEFYAIQGDRRLPAADRGTAPGGPDTPGMLALSDWSHLSKADRKALVPYLLPPNYPQSAWAPRSKTRPKSKTTANRHAVRRLAIVAGSGDTPIGDKLVCPDRPESPSGVWKYTRKVGSVAIHAVTASSNLFHKAEVLARAVPTVYNTLVTTDGFPAPLPDTECDATGDPRLDVFLVPPDELAGQAGGEASAATIGLRCFKSSAFILMADNLSDEQLRVSFAHEFFHAEQAGAVGDCAAPLGWAEGAATWAQTEVFPKNKLTHKFFFWSLSPDVFTLKNAGAPVAEGYHAWPFWYFLRKQYGATAIGEMFTLLGAGVAFDDAVRAAPGVDFGTVWKDFAVAMYNQTPVGEAGFPLQSFSAWDDYNDHPALPRDAKINLELGGSESGPDPDTFRTKVATKPLGLNYLDLNVIDQDVKEVTITNGFGPSGQVGVELWADTTSGWKRIDLSRESTKSFCFDTPDETFTHAIVAISNAGKTAQSENIDATVATSCQPHVMFDGFWDCSDPCGGKGSMHFAWTGSAKIAIDPSIFTELGVTTYGLMSGTLTVTATGVDPNGCTINGSQTVTLLPGADTVSLALMAQPPTYQFTITTAGEDIILKYSGCDHPPPDLPYPLSSLLYANTPSPVARDPAMTMLEDTVDSPAQPGAPVEREHWQISL